MKKILCCVVRGMTLVSDMFCNVVHYSIGYILSKDSNGCIESIQVLEDDGKFSKIYCYSIGNKIYCYKEIKVIQKKEKSPIEKILEVANSTTSKIELLGIISKLSDLYNKDNTECKLTMNVEEFKKGKKVE